MNGETTIRPSAGNNALQSSDAYQSFETILESLIIKSGLDYDVVRLMTLKDEQKDHSALSLFPATLSG